MKCSSIVEMPTKYELQAQLRELNRGFPRIPISKLKMHEIEAHIDAIKKVKAETEAILPTKTPARTGPKDPRPIPVEEVASGSVTIRTPKVPPVRNVGVPKGKKPGKAITAEDDPFHSDLFPAVRAQGPQSPLPRQKSKAVTVCMCNCPDCPR